MTVAPAPGACTGPNVAEPDLLEPTWSLKSAHLQPRGRGQRPHRTVYLAGQTGVNASGKIVEGFRAQAVQVMENLKTALASVGGDFEHNKAALPASALARCSGLPIRIISSKWRS